MRSWDSVKAYTQTRLNGWSHQDAVKAAGVVFSSGGFGGLASQEWWPNTFRKLTDPWWVRAGWDARGIGTAEYLRNSVSTAALAWIQRNFIAARPRVVKGEGDDAKEIDGHGLTRILARPNPRYSGHWLWQITLNDWWVTGRGNAYWLKERDGAGKVTELWHVPSVEIVPDFKRGERGPNGFVSQYIRTVNGERVPIPYQDVVHFRSFGIDPANIRLGWSPVMAGQSEVGLLNEGAEYRGSVLANHGVPSYALTPADKEQSEALSPEAAEDVEKVFVSKFTGRGRASGLFIPNFLAQLTRIGFSPEELDIRRMMEWDADMLCALYGLSSMVLGLPSGEGHRTYANQADAREAAHRENIIPTQAVFAAELELQLLPDFDEDESHHVTWDYSQVGVLQEDQNALRSSIAEQVKAGVWTVNEGRVKQGLKEVKEERYDKPLPLTQDGYVDPDAEPAQGALPPGQNGATPPESGGDRAALNGKEQPALPPAEDAQKALRIPVEVQVTEQDIAAARRRWAEVVGEKYAGLLEANGNGKH